MAWVAVRVRGRVGVRWEIEETLRRLMLTRVNHAVVLPQTPEYEGMLKKAKDFITWGEIEEGVLRELILRRGELRGDGRVDENRIREITGMNIDELVEAVIGGKVKLHKILKPFRLHPPKKGFRSIKKPFKLGGALGYRGKEINDLIRRMV